MVLEENAFVEIDYNEHNIKKTENIDYYEDITTRGGLLVPNLKSVMDDGVKPSAFNERL